MVNDVSIYEDYLEYIENYVNTIIDINPSIPKEDYVQQGFLIIMETVERKHLTFDFTPGVGWCKHFRHNVCKGLRQMAEDNIIEDTYSYDEDDVEIVCRIEGYDSLCREYVMDKLYSAMDKCSERERAIVMRYIGFESNGETLAKIGDDYFISAMRTCQIYNRTLSKLRHSKNIIEIEKFIKG